MTDSDLMPLSLPASGDWTAWVAERGDGQLALARTVVDELKASPPADALGALRAFNRAMSALDNAASVGSLMGEVHPDSAARDRADEVLQEVQKLQTEWGLDQDLYAIFAGLSADGLDDDAQRVLEHTLRDFRRAGVDRDEATRARLKELNEKAVKLSQDFGRNIREDVRSISVTPDRLAGLPQDWIDAHPAGDDGLVTITTDYPDLVPFMTFAHDAEARQELSLASSTVAWPANDSVLQDLLATRRETADLLGYASWPDLDAEVKMIGEGKAIGEFIDRIHTLAKDRAQRDADALLERKRADVPDATDVLTSDARYYPEVIRREQYGVDGQQVRTYFPFESVRQGLLDVTGRLFGLDWTAVPADEAGTWHDEVATYDVGLDGVRVGRIHLDLHPRDGKYKHAAQFDLVRGVAGAQLPEGVLVCNFNRGLMEHDEVVTLFHEFGHLIHHVLGGQGEWARFSGVATEWDFVEAPSQMLEEWAWDADVLATFARNAEGEVIPADLVAAMRRAEDFGQGAWVAQQMAYAAQSYWLHSQETDDLTTLSDQMQDKYAVYTRTPGGHRHCSFGHLDGYSSGYYTYMWSLVIAKDLFSAFDKDDMFAPEVAGAYRDKVLAMGGRKDAADLVADFLGRPYSFDAFGEWLEG